MIDDILKEKCKHFPLFIGLNYLGGIIVDIFQAIIKLWYASFVSVD